MKIALVDDDQQALDRLHTYITELVGAAARLDCFASGEEFLAAWHPGAYDLIVLDIFMHQLTGMEVARTIRETDQTVRLVFATSSNEFASESYEVNARYYLHKPFQKEQVKVMLDRLDMEEVERLRSVTLPDGQTVVLRRVIYADFAAHCVTVHNKDGHNITARVPFAEVEPLFCGYSYFCSPCKGVIINFYEVAARPGAKTFMRSWTSPPRTVTRWATRSCAAVRISPTARKTAISV